MNRCIDKAAILEQASPRQELEVESIDENLCSVAEVRKAKSLIRLIPLWFAFILYGTVTAAGSTFFIEQSNGLDEYIGNNFKVSVNSFFIMRSFAASIASFLANLVVSRFCNRNETWVLKGGLIRVGLGFIVSVLCCQTAYQIEYVRLDQLRTYGDPDIEDVTLHMSILWLAPQFILLGLMDGLSEDGLIELFYVLVDEHMEGIETPINQLMLGIGKLVSVGCVFVFRDWFGHTINTSRLDKYFNMLMYLSIGNLAFYLVIGSYYVHVHKKEVRFELDRPQHRPSEQEQGGGGGGGGNSSQQVEEERNDIVMDLVVDY
ncbi:Major facilitator superfamily protein [Euphorbia peplus]|nr:Major facilitator superfamily protein [Euphorbia peplus]